jgi:hypothetical protein
MSFKKLDHILHVVSPCWVRLLLLLFLFFFGGGQHFDKLATVEEFYQWLQGPFVNAAFSSHTFDGHGDFKNQVHRICMRARARG